MAKIKQVQEKETRKKARHQEKEPLFRFPLEKRNFQILAAGIFLIIIGYIFMALPDHPDDFLTLTLAPIILVLSFFVIIPLGILYRGKKTKKQ